VLEKLNAVEAITELSALLTTWHDDAEQVAVHYEIWRIDPTQEDARQKAALVYGELYSRTPNIEYRQRYEELTGAKLPEPPALPPLPESIMGEPVDLTALLRRVGVEV